MLRDEERINGKKKRLEKGIYIDDDYTKEEREVQRVIRIRVREEKQEKM